jgi:hypothetical protein
MQSGGRTTLERHAYFCLAGPVDGRIGYRGGGGLFADVYDIISALGNETGTAAATSAASEGESLLTELLSLF